MALKYAQWSDIESMPAFERQHFYEEAVELFTSKETGTLIVR